MTRPQEFNFALTIATFVALFAANASQGQIAQTNLVSDDQGVNASQITDTNLKNAWGIAASGSSPFWVSSNGAGLATLYSVNPANDATTKVGLEVTIPGDGNVTGQVFANVAGNFNGDAFLFVSEDGTISGWRGALGTTAEILQSPSTDNVYKGVAFATIGGNAYLYAANFHTGMIDVIKGNPGAPNLGGNFTDPNLPAGYAPFNIQLLGGKLYVTYALQDGTGHDDVPGAGHGFVDAFDTNGVLQGRIATQGALNSPWGLAIAPAGFAGYGGDLLVGNFGDGRINAYNLSTLALVGPLIGVGVDPIVIDGLWGLSVGNGGSAGSAAAVYFSAGPVDETHGLFGVLRYVPEPSTAALCLVACGLLLARLGLHRGSIPAKSAE